MENLAFALDFARRQLRAVLARHPGFHLAAARCSIAVLRKTTGKSCRRRNLLALKIVTGDCSLLKTLFSSQHFKEEDDHAAKSTRNPQETERPNNHG
jgi:hypothetical protein